MVNKLLENYIHREIKRTLNEYKILNDYPQSYHQKIGVSEGYADFLHLSEKSWANIWIL